MGEDGLREGGVTGKQTNTQTPATAATLVSRWSTAEVIYNYQGHRSQLHTSRVWLLHRDREEEAQRSNVYTKYSD